MPACLEIIEQHWLSVFFTFHLVVDGALVHCCTCCGWDLFLLLHLSGALFTAAPVEGRAFVHFCTCWGWGLVHCCTWWGWGLVHCCTCWRWGSFHMAGYLSWEILGSILSSLPTSLKRYLDHRRLLLCTALHGFWGPEVRSACFPPSVLPTEPSLRPPVHISSLATVSIPLSRAQNSTFQNQHNL